MDGTMNINSVQDRTGYALLIMYNLIRETRARFRRPEVATGAGICSSHKYEIGRIFSRFLRP